MTRRSISSVTRCRGMSSQRWKVTPVSLVAVAMGFLSKGGAEQAAIDLQRRSVDVAGALGQQERDGVGELLDAAEPARRDVGDDALLPRGARGAVLLGAQIVEVDLAIGEEVAG